MKYRKLSANTLAFLSSVYVYSCGKPVFAESSLYFIFYSGYLRYGEVYGRESGRFRTLPFFLTFFFIICNHVYNMPGFTPQRILLIPPRFDCFQIRICRASYSGKRSLHRHHQHVSLCLSEYVMHE